MQLPEALKATGSMEELIEHTEIFLMVVPTPFVAATMTSIKDKLKPNQVSPPSDYWRVSKMTLRVAESRHDIFFRLTWQNCKLIDLSKARQAEDGGQK